MHGVQGLWALARVMSTWGLHARVVSMQGFTHSRHANKVSAHLVPVHVRSALLCHVHVRPVAQIVSTPISRTQFVYMPGPRSRACSCLSPAPGLLVSMQGPHYLSCPGRVLCSMPGAWSGLQPCGKGWSGEDGSSTRAQQQSGKGGIRGEPLPANPTSYLASPSNMADPLERETHKPKPEA